jgi:alpha-1,6-mannosyltransferase
LGDCPERRSPELAIDCLRALRASGVDATLVLAGDGPLRGELTRRTAGFRYRFVGHVAARDGRRPAAGVLGRGRVPSSVEAFGLGHARGHGLWDSGGRSPQAVRHPNSSAPMAPVLCARRRPAGSRTASASCCRRPADQRRAAARRAAELFPWSATVGRLLEGYHGLVGSVPRQHQSPFRRDAAGSANWPGSPRRRRPGRRPEANRPRWRRSAARRYRTERALRSPLITGSVMVIAVRAVGSEPSAKLS